MGICKDCLTRHATFIFFYEVNLDNKVKDLLNSLLMAIEAEREEERNFHINEIKRLSPIEREKKGRALVGLKKQKPTMTITGDYLYRFRKRDRSDFPDFEFSTGDQVIISQYDPLDALNPSGVVYEIGKNYIVVQTSSNLTGGGGRPYRLDLFVNDLTYQRMQTAINLAKSPGSTLIQTILSGAYSANTKSSFSKMPSLNEKQTQGVDYALSCNGFYVIQGPPGTGKTYMGAHLVRELIDSGKRVLISADSNAAVDNLIKKCLDLGIEPLRVGHPIRVNSDLKKYTLDYRVVGHALSLEIQDIEAEIEKYKDRLRELDKPKQKDLRGYSYEEVMNMIKRNQSGRGISKRTLRSMKPYVKTQLKIQGFYDKIKELKQEITDKLMSEAKLVAATNSTCGSELFDNYRFDFNIIDEASQASIPSSLIPIQRADRFVLIGDHFQLPPVVISREAVRLGLSRSLMDYMAGLYPYQMTMLEVQYRMNREINDLVSGLFYSSKLKPHSTVTNRRLKLPRAYSTKPIEFIDVDGREGRRADTKSYFNRREAEVCRDIINSYIEAGLTPEQISVISPYRAQVEDLRAMIPEVEVDTVDAFQGRENDLVIISFVRSNDIDALGFLKDGRRLNVSLSRAKKKLILVGSKVLLSKDELYNSVISMVDYKKIER